MRLWVPLLLLACQGGPGPNDPVVVVVTVDDAAPSRWGAYGGPATPLLDEALPRHTAYTRAVLPPSSPSDLIGDLAHDVAGRTVAAVAPDLAAGRGFEVVAPPPVHGPGGPTADDVVTTALDAMFGPPWDRRPRVVWLHLSDPTDPLQPPRGYAEDATVAAGSLTDAALSPADRRALYDGEVRFVDVALARLVRVIADRGWMDRTLFVVAGVRGTRLGEDGTWGSAPALDPRVVHVPLIVVDRGDRLASRPTVDTPVDARRVPALVTAWLEGRRRVDPLVTHEPVVLVHDGERVTHPAVLATGPDTGDPAPTPETP